MHKHNGHRIEEGQPTLRLVQGNHPRLWVDSRERSACLRVTKPVMAEVHATVGSRPPETGGMLGGSRLDAIVRHFRFDETASVSGVTYSPDHKALTALLKDEWNPRGDNLLGFVHSHPGSFRRPSTGDMRYAAEMLRRNPELDELLVPIITRWPQDPVADFASYAIHLQNGEPCVRQLDLEVVPEPQLESPERHAVFERVQDAYDLERMGRTRVVVVGTGGASGFAEDLCRAGVGEVVLIDPDVVEAVNIATQQVRLADVGRPKVEALARRLIEVSPAVVVAAVHASLDALSDRDFQRLATGRMAGRPAPEVTLVCGCTDNFWAQARVARLALNLGLPSLAAQVYAEGRGAEVTFALPGVTPACQRCALGSRYRAFLRDGYRNGVGSHATPIFATTRLNSLKGFVALALIHGAGEHPAQGRGAGRWLRLLERIGERNLIMIRLDPDAADSLRMTVFDRVLGGADQSRLVADETVWLPQLPEHPDHGFEPCGDCGGTGDLRDAVGALADSRLVAKEG
jgi:molybdopterin/thiamine biosynthesis adenylyltransferase/proteasome lid subunit RPN8/RPN11